MSSFIDGLTIPITFFGLVVALVFVSFIFTMLYTASPSLFGTTVGPKLVQTFTLLKTLIPMFLLFMALGAIVSAFLIKTHPIFFAISIVLLLVQMLITPMITNLWSSIMTANADIQTEAESFAFAMILFNNLPLISFVLSLLIVLISFMRGVG
jgi:hypothetical protein